MVKKKNRGAIIFTDTEISGNDDDIFASQI